MMLPRAAGTKRRAPRWARWCVLVGSLLLVAGGGAAVATKVLLRSATGAVAQQDLLGTVRSGAQRKHAQIAGAKNILLVGLDTRPNQDPSKLTRSDSIILFHIPADRSIGYLISLPRDSLVDLPAYDNGKVPFPGGQAKI